MSPSEFSRLVRDMSVSHSSVARATRWWLLERSLELSQQLNEGDFAGPCRT